MESVADPDEYVDVERGRYDQSTFAGRLRHMFDVTSPTTLFTTRRQVEEAKRTINMYVEHRREPQYLRNVDMSRVWRAKQITDSVLHPQTGEMVPAPLRISAFVPMNIFLCWGLLTPNPSLGQAVFWQWLNQSYNLAINHANRNASNEMNNSQIVGSYVGAVVTSCSIAVGLNEAVKRSIVPRTVAPAIPYLAVSTAGMVNVFLMRWNEVSEGVVVQDEYGTDLGVSKKAGLIGVSLCALSRAVWTAPALVIPPIVMSLLKRTHWFKALPKRAHLPIELASIGVSLFFGVPFAIALFKSRMDLPVSYVEEEFQDALNSKGEPLQHVYFNKGL